MRTELPVTELKTFVPARDFELSKRFYVDLGFTLEWTSIPEPSDIAGLGAGVLR
jgi:hypothetical protein